MNRKPILLRVTTVPISISILLKGQLKFMSENGFEVHTASAIGQEIDDFVKREEVIHHIIPMTRIISPIRDVMALVKLIVLIKKLKPSIVHSHTPKAGLLAMMAAFICRVPIRMHTVAGMPIMEAKGMAKSILSITEKVTYAMAHFVYPNSISLKEYLIKHYPAFKKKIKVIANGSSNGIDIEYYQSRPSLSPLTLPEGAFVFTYVGRLLKDKGTEELITSFVKLNSLFPHVHLLLIGRYEEDRDPLPQEIRSRIDSHHAIHAVGFQPDIRPYLTMSNVFVFPSYREGFPNVVLQALCMGLPVVATRINGCDEMILENQNGFLIPAKSWEALYEKMILFVQDPDLVIKMSSKARTSVVQRYDRNLVWQAILMEYRNLLADVSQLD